MSDRRRLAARGGLEAWRIDGDLRLCVDGREFGAFASDDADEEAVDGLQMLLESLCEDILGRELRDSESGLCRAVAAAAVVPEADFAELLEWQDAVVREYGIPDEALH